MSSSDHSKIISKYEFFDHSPCGRDAELKEIDSKISSLSASWLDNPEEEDGIHGKETKFEEDYS
jgi:hypothetical protein